MNLEEKWKQAQFEMLKKDWGCPDWRDADSYPSEPERLRDWEWRWEFLRRDQNYRIVWILHKDVDFMAIKGVHVPLRELYHRVFNFEDLVDPSKSVRDLKSSPFRDTAGTMFVMPPRNALDDWFIENDIDHNDVSAKYEFLVDYLEMVGLLENEKSVFRFFRFDTHRPLKPQLRHVNEMIEAHNKAARAWNKMIKRDMKKQPDAYANDPEAPGLMPLSVRLGGSDMKLWPRYLRLIDAKDQGATHSEIANQFVDDGFADEMALYKRTGSQETQDARHKAIISQWLKAAYEVRGKASIFL